MSIPEMMVEPPVRPGVRRSRSKRLPWRLPEGLLPEVTLLVLVLVAITAPWISPYDPERSDIANRLLAPSLDHPFGTDGSGFDVFSRVLWATRIDLTVAVAGTLIGALIGAVLGVTLGYLGGWLDETCSRITEMLQAIPLLLFAIMVFAAMGNSRFVLIGVIAFANAPAFFKLTRTVALPLRQADFVSAAICLGLPRWKIIVRHLVPNAMSPVLSQFSVSCALAIQIVAGLSFLGLGVPIPKPEWGSMIQIGAPAIVEGQWWPSVFPGVALLLAVLAFDGISGRLRKWFER